MPSVSLSELLTSIMGEVRGATGVDITLRGVVSSILVSSSKVQSTLEVRVIRRLPFDFVKSVSSRWIGFEIISGIPADVKRENE